MKKQRTTTTRFLLAGAALTLFAGPMPVAAQTVPFGLEGPLEAVLPAQNAVVVMRARVNIPPGTPINTPTRRLPNIRNLLGNPLPGRFEADGITPTRGFLKGTAIINGTINDVTGALDATDVFVEPAENVTIGTLTEAVCTNAACAGAGNRIRINGTAMVPLRDPRIAAGPATNEFGFAVDLTGLTVDPAAGPSGITAEAEGYFAGGSFRYFHIAVGAGAAPLVNAGVPEVSITRAQCRLRDNGIELSILGNTHPAAGAITISNGGTTFGSVNAVAAGVAGFGAYNFDLRGNPAFTVCPANITADFGGATATSPVDIIID
jgi:hypothetical protein